MSNPPFSKAEKRSSRVVRLFSRGRLMRRTVWDLEMKSLSHSPNTPERVSAYCSQHALRLHWTTKTASGSPHNKDNGRRPIGALHSTKQKPLLPSGFLSSSVADLAVNQLDGSKRKQSDGIFQHHLFLLKQKGKKKELASCLWKLSESLNVFSKTWLVLKVDQKLDNLWNNFV